MTNTTERSKSGVIPDFTMPTAERVVVAEKLRLALDEIETGAADYISVRNAVSLQREALRIATRRLDALRGAITC